MSLSLSSYLSLCVSLSVSSRGDGTRHELSESVFYVGGDAEIT